MKATLVYEEEKKRVIAHLKNCPKPDGTTADFTWIVCRDDMPFLGQEAPTEAMMRGLDGQEMEIEDAEMLWTMAENKQTSISSRITPPTSKKSPYSEIWECIGLLNSMIISGESHSDVSQEAVRKARWALEELEKRNG